MRIRTWIPVIAALALAAFCGLFSPFFIYTATSLAQGSGGCSIPRFGAPTTFPVASAPLGSSIADFNGDNRPDIAVVASNANAVSVALGNGNGTFAAAVNFAVGARPVAVRVGDLNGDQRLDLITANQNSNNVSVLLGNGQGGFAAATAFAAGNGPTSVAVGDLNGDSRLDLAVTNLNSNNVSLLAGNGQGGFAAAVNFGVGTRPVFVVIGDFNLDARPDLVTANEFGSNISILLNNGMGGFGAATNRMVGNFPRSIVVGDINGDDKADLVVLNTLDNTISILANTCNAAPCATPSFAAAVTAATGTIAADTIAAADFNGDNRLDLVVDSFITVSVLLGSGTGVFPNVVDFPANQVVNSVTTGDLNLDQKPDIVFTTTPNAFAGVLLNTCGLTTIAAVPTTMNFETVALGQSLELPLTISNPGEQPVTVNSFAADNPSYSVPTPGTPFTLQGGGERIVLVRFAPSFVGDQNATLIVANDSVEHPMLAVNLRGAGFDPCSYSIAPRSRSFPSSGGAGSVSVTAEGGCNWTATSNAPWITITAGVQGSGNGRVDYTVAPDPAQTFRSGSLTIAGQTFSVIEGTLPPGVWSPLQSGTTNLLSDVHFIDENDGWAVGPNTTVVHTIDGGASWMRIDIPDLDASRGFNSVRLLTPQVGWAGGLQAVIRSTDGGLSAFGVQFAGNSPFRNKLFPVSENVAWAVGGGTLSGMNARYFFRYSFNPDGSLSTFTASEVSGDLLQDLYFIDPNQGWAVGSPGRIVRIGNAGGVTPNFTNQTSGTTQQLNGIDMLDASTGWVVGNGGTILKTINGGMTWVPQTSGVQANLLDVDFIDASRGWVVGAGGTILTTANGGATWAPEMSVVEVDLRSVSFAGPNAGYAVGAGGTILKRTGAPTTVTTVSAASFARDELAAGSIAAAFGQGLAASTETPTGLPLPIELGGARVEVRDAAGSVRSCALFFASGNQINLQIPPATVEGPATINVIRGGTIVASGMVTIARVAPGLFAANADGTGIAAASALRIKQDGTRIDEPVAVFDQGQTRFVPVPIDLDSETDQVFLLLFGTGIRFNSGLPGVTVQIGGMNQEVSYAGPQGAFVGLDQLNVRLSRQLIGRGELDVVLRVDGKTANTVRIAIK